MFIFPSGRCEILHNAFLLFSQDLDFTYHEGKSVRPLSETFFIMKLKYLALCS